MDKSAKVKPEYKILNTLGRGYPARCSYCGAIWFFQEKSDAMELDGIPICDECDEHELHKENQKMG